MSVSGLMIIRVGLRCLRYSGDPCILGELLYFVSGSSSSKHGPRKHSHDVGHTVDDINPAFP